MIKCLHTYTPTCANAVNLHTSSRHHHQHHGHHHSYTLPFVVRSRRGRRRRQRRRRRHRHRERIAEYLISLDVYDFTPDPYYIKYACVSLASASVCVSVCVCVRKRPTHKTTTKATAAEHVHVFASITSGTLGAPVGPGCASLCRRPYAYCARATRARVYYRRSIYMLMVCMCKHLSTHDAVCCTIAALTFQRSNKSRHVRAELARAADRVLWGCVSA